MLKIFNIINPFFLLMKLWKIIIELDNFIYFHRQINNLKNSKTYTLYNLKIDSINRLYMVINLPPEILLADNKADIEKQEKEIVANQVIKLEKLLQDYKIYEFTIYKLRRRKDDSYYCYQLWTNFRFKELKILWILWIFSFFFFSTRFLLNYDWLNLFNTIKDLF
jgi:hypothetical protein